MRFGETMTDSETKPDHWTSRREDKAENDPTTQSRAEVFHSEYGVDESPSEAVVSAVSEVKGVEPMEMDCLYDRIDPDALDTFMDGPVVIGDGGIIDVEFQYSGYRVSVRNNGTITILEHED